jgi:hypothetical protein
MNFLDKRQPQKTALALEKKYVQIHIIFFSLVDDGLFEES